MTIPANFKHGLWDTRIYGIWGKMIDRCHKLKNDSFKYYGARGIIVCDLWRSEFLAFNEWSLANGYGDHLSIDRRDNDGNYEPENCRWATAAQQARNRSNTRLFDFRGEKMILSDIAKACGVRAHVLYHRVLNSGWSVEAAIWTPIEPTAKSGRIWIKPTLFNPGRWAAS